ncbi:MAG: hypothetical protein QM758_08590 [Armatimonas sp.]
MSEWYPFENGETIGHRGPEGGRVVSDEELGDSEDPEDADARLTLESDGENYTRTIANLYGGWMYLVVERDVVEELRIELERLSGLIPMEDERDIDGKVRTLLKEIEVFEARYIS